MQLRDMGTRTTNVLSLPLDKITIDPEFNVRVDYGDIPELAKQISENGQHEPGRVRLSDDGTCAVLVEGHRRFKAIQYANEKLNAGIDGFLCLPETKGTNEETRIVGMFMSNSGKPLTLLEQAEAVRRLQNKAWDIARIAKTIGKSSAFINQLLTLQGASTNLREAVGKNIISPTAALKLAAQPVAKQKSVLEKVQSTITAATTTTPKGNVSKKKAVKVKDIEAEVRGTPTSISSKKIRDLLKEIDTLIGEGKRKAQWEAVKYGLQLALGKEKLDPSVLIK
jgi:ParB/RepB/Spo0J family partition protein